MMNTKHISSLIVAASISLLVAMTLSTAAVSQDTRKPSLSITELLELVRSGRVEVNESAEQREQRFRNEASRQQQMLNQIKARIASEEKRSRSLESQANDLQSEIEILRQQKEEKQGALKEVFGNIQAAASESAENYALSLTTPQVGKSRIKAMNDLANQLQSEDKLPSIASLERFWYEYFNEIVESGRVVRFNGRVRSLVGADSQCSVVRVGLFNAICDGEYVVISQSNPALYSRLPRQPGEGIGFGSKYLGPAQEFSNAKNSNAALKFGFDPTGPSGSGLLRSLISVPDIGERIAQGREVGYTIIIVGLFGLVLAIYKMLELTFVGIRVSSQLRNPGQPSNNNPLGRILSVYKNESNSDVEALELKLAEAIARERPSIERFVSFLKIIAAVAPLMGLLGTVTGMIDTFQQITLFGTGDPKTMAGGISQALVTTVLGLCVAIPMILLHAVVSSRSQSLQHILEERSIGLVAGRAEQLAQEYLAEQSAKAEDER